MALSTSSAQVGFLEREIRMVLVGKTGVGKSATGNTIVGEEVFKSSLWGKSETSVCKQHSFDRDGYELQLVDVPGLCETNESEENIRQKVVQCVDLSSPGIHAILYIIAVGRYTGEDEEAVNMFIKWMGEECRKYVLVIFTGKDKLDKEGATVQDFIGECPPSLQTFITSVQGRYLAVENSQQSQDKETFTKELVKLVLQMVQTNGGRSYTNDMYKNAEIQMKKAEDDEMEKIDAANRAKDEKLILEERARIEEEFTKQCLVYDDRNKKTIDNLENKILQLENDQRKEARRRAREAAEKQFGLIVGGIGAFSVGLGGAVVAGPVGAAAGAAAGAAIGGVIGGYLGWE